MHILKSLFVYSLPLKLHMPCCTGEEEWMPSDLWPGRSQGTVMNSNVSACALCNFTSTGLPLSCRKWVDGPSSPRAETLLGSPLMESFIYITLPSRPKPGLFGGQPSCLGRTSTFSSELKWHTQVSKERSHQSWLDLVWQTKLCASVNRWWRCGVSGWAFNHLSS